MDDDNRGKPTCDPGTEVPKFSPTLKQGCCVLKPIDARPCTTYHDCVNSSPFGEWFGFGRSGNYGCDWVVECRKSNADATGVCKLRANGERFAGGGR